MFEKQISLQTFISYFTSPVGYLKIEADENVLQRLNFIDTPQNDAIKENEAIKKCKQQLDEYFLGKRKDFDLSLALNGTPFQNKVWNELLSIPFGKTISYLQLAKKLSDGKCIRAVGTANGKNPMAIIVPCHRVIGSDGKLVGYAGGLGRKKFLLQHEMKFANADNSKLF